MSDQFILVKNGDLSAHAPLVIEAIEKTIAGELQVSPTAPGETLVDRDKARLVEYIEAEETSTLVRLWQNKPCLVATQRHSGRDGFAQASEISAREGWPIQVRSTGGTVVPHGPGILNVSVLHTIQALDIDSGYQPLLDIISAALDQMNITHSWGNRDRSFCDGKFNLLIDERKAAGTAARFKRGPVNRWLSHASLLVSCDMEACLNAVSRFESLLGLEPDYDAAAHINIADAMGLSFL